MQRRQSETFKKPHNKMRRSSSISADHVLPASIADKYKDDMIKEAENESHISSDEDQSSNNLLQEK